MTITKYARADESKIKVVNQVCQQALPMRF